VMFMRFLGQSLGAASFGAVLNFTLLRQLPGTVHLVDQLLDPEARNTLPASELQRLTDIIAAGLHNTYVLACLLSLVSLGLALLLPARLSPTRQT
jgi:hypothetical protein